MNKDPKESLDKEEVIQNEQTANGTESNSENAPQTEEAEMSDADKMSAMAEEIDNLKDKYLRQVAEFDNYRKRTLKEKTELILNGGEKVLSALLPVLDDLERAAANIEQSNDIETLKEGVALIIDKLNKALSAQGLQKIDTIGKSFDTDFHEAVAMIPAQEEAQKNHIIDCVQTGYLLNDKVIRHAKVVVGQ